MDNKSSIIGFVIYFWIFQISAFLMMRLFGLVSADSPLKHVLILFVVFGLAFTGFYFIKRSGDAKRAQRNATAKYDVAHANKKKKKEKEIIYKRAEFLPFICLEGNYEHTDIRDKQMQ